MHLPEKQKGFSQLFCAIFKSTLNFEHFKTKMTLIAYRFRIYGFPKTLLDKSLKSPLADNPLRGTLVNRTKHCFNLNNSTSTIFIDSSKGN